MVHVAASASFICVDGTFSRCHPTHYQLVTFHAVCWNGFSFPFAHALLLDKKSATYSTLFTGIDSITRRKFGVNVYSRTSLTVSCDFERGLLKALLHLDCFVKCCYFHQTQTILRFVAKHGLSGKYMSNETFRWSVRSLMYCHCSKKQASMRSSMI